MLANHRHRRLRARRERPCRRRAADKRDEFAPPHIEHGASPSRLSWAPPVGPFGQVPHAEAAAEAPRGPWARPELFCESPTAKAGPGIQLNEHTQDADRVSSALEGIVSKRNDTAYRSGRSPDWLKSKDPWVRRGEASVALSKASAIGF